MQHIALSMCCIQEFSEVIYDLVLYSCQKHTVYNAHPNFFYLILFQKKCTLYTRKYDSKCNGVHILGRF